MYDFLGKYGDFSFKEKPFTEVDNLILSTILYLDFSGIVPSDKKLISLKNALELYYRTHIEKNVTSLGVAMKNAWNIGKILEKSRRYKNLLVSNYRYIIDSDTQFSALTVHFGIRDKFIVFEGTDEMISGWKEDFFLPFKFPVDAHTYAIDYINQTVNVFDRTIYVGGHSKGGNLALVSAMYAKPFIRRKIKVIYSNDGPGLREQEFNTKAFENIKSKYIHFVPDHSIFGMLLKNTEHTCIKSNRRGLLAHSSTTWEVEDDHFVRAELSEGSKNLEKNLSKCLASIPIEKQEQTIDLIFQAVQNSGANTTHDLLSPARLVKIISNLRGVDKKTKKVMTETLSLIFKAVRAKWNQGSKETKNAGK